MSRKLNSSVLGAWTFFASAHPIDLCGINGLPLTPNSIRILGRFQKLKALIHSNICLYLDVQRGKHERIMIVSEYYSNSLCSKKSRQLLKGDKSLTTAVFQILDALSYLHSNGIVHRCLSPRSILIDTENNIKLFHYGLYHMTEGGSSVSFPIGVPKYMAPEILCCNPSLQSDQNLVSGPKCDVWSFGMIALEWVLDIRLWEDFSLEETFQAILSLLKLDSGHDVVESIAKDHDSLPKLQDLTTGFRELIESCLTVIPDDRPTAIGLLKHSYFEIHGLAENSKNLFLNEAFLSVHLRCKNTDVMKTYPVIEDHLAERPLREVYYLWQLAGGDVEAELRRQELIKAKSSIITISNLVVEEGEEFGYKKDRAFLLDDSVLQLPLEQLRHRLKAVDPSGYYPLIEYVPNGMTGSLNGPNLQEAKIDIPPLYRARIWAALLEIEGDIATQYAAIDKETPTPTDRQIEVDIPRCHQYDELLSSPTGHAKFKRVLKAWVVSHPQYVYWQGLDSLCAAFLYLNFNDEALAYACLTAFIPKYLHNFFLKDNSLVIQEYLAKFSHLIAYHDPELTNHLDNIGFIPELYAIPWFLTMYTHVFPLHKIFHLWDTLLLGKSSFPLCIGVAILKQLRNNLLAYGFNECILMFSDMPEIDMQRCVQDSIKIFCSTPESIAYREHDNKTVKVKKSRDRPVVSVKNQENTNYSELGMSALSFTVLKSELCPRISAEDLLGLLNLLPEGKIKPVNVKILVIDVRPNEEFIKGSLPDSINIPFSTAFTPEGVLMVPEANKIQSYKVKMITVIGSSKNNHAVEFGTKLVRSGHSRVSTLHGGIDVLRKTGLLTVRVNPD